VIQIRDARFVDAATRIGCYPDLRGPRGDRVAEIAFAGRSNVGKSSLINTLVGRRGLARTGSTPGRTRQLNFFAVDTAHGSVVLVDLPGYGFARAARTERARWGPLIERYLNERPALRGVVLVIDARRGIESEDLALLEYLHVNELPAIVVATKVDKLRHGERGPAVAAVMDSLASGAESTPVLAASAATHAGRDELWRILARPPLAVFESERGGR